MKWSAALCLIFSIDLLAAPPAAIPPVKFTDTRLENGLRVIVSEDHSAPVFAIAVSYAVGSKDERKGRTGFAHLFEHMMFRGSENVGVGEHFFLVFNNGGSMNGTTNNDRTLYYEVMPKNQLDLALYLEADRMRSLAVTQESLENQRQAVKEERRLRVDNQPYGKTFERADEIVYQNFAYKHSVIGSMEDLDAASLDDVKDFFKTYYAPNNAVLALVGDLDTKATIEKVRKQFASIPKQQAPKPVDLSEPEQAAEQRERIEDRFARLARLDILYKLPPGPTPDVDALAVLASVMGGGESSRLYQKLVKEKEVAVQVGAYIDYRIGPSQFQVTAFIKSGQKPEIVESLISEELSKVMAEPVTNAELDRARMTIRRTAIQSRQTVLGRAIRLADDAALYSDPGRINTLPARRMAVTAQAMQEMARKHLPAANRTVLTTVAAPRQGKQ